MNRLIKRKNLFALLFAVLLALPMCAILGRVLYTQWNKNAKDSYSGYGDNQVVYEYVSTFTANQYLYYSKPQTDNTTDTSSYIKCDFIIFENSRTDIQTWFNNNEENIGGFQIRLIGTSYQIAFYDLDDVYMDYYGLSNSTTNIYFFTKNSGTFSGENNFYQVQRNSVLYLDNAFEYSVNQFINDNNFGKLDFFQWFDNMFLDSTNTVNNMYVHFVNWYLNYALLISLAYILFLVLMWFINYVRKLLEKGMDFGEGSY